MHELPIASWILIACSTVPWIVLAGIHYFRNAGRDRATRTFGDDG